MSQSENKQLIYIADELFFKGGILAIFVGCWTLPIWYTQNCGAPYQLFEIPNDLMDAEVFLIWDLNRVADFWHVFESTACRIVDQLLDYFIVPEFSGGIQCRGMNYLSS